MNKEVGRKGIVIAIILLFVGAGIVPYVSADHISNKKVDKTAPLSSNLVAYWKFDEGSGSIVHDSSGNGNDGMINDCNWVSGHDGTALEFPGIDSMVYGIPSSMDSQITNYVIVDAWVDWYGISYLGSYIFDCRCYFGGFYFFITNTNKLAFCYYATSTDQPYLYSISDIPLNTWTHVKAVLDLTTNSLSLYINDVLDNSMTVTLPYSHTYNQGAIGNNLWAPGDGNWRPFNGIIDDLSIWKGPENFPPVANFSWTPQNPYSNTVVTFDASSSYDPDGTIVLYEWDWNHDGTYEESHTTPMATHTFSSQGNYPVTLRVTDNGGATGTITKSVYIKNQPPGAPIITGPTTGKPNVAHQWNFTATDPDNNEVFYQIDWGDGNLSVWYGPFPSGVPMAQSHDFTAKGTYTIKSKAKDTYGDESNWSTLIVNMPLAYIPPNPQFFAWLFERFPHAFPILRQLLGY